MTRLRLVGRGMAVLGVAVALSGCESTGRYEATCSLFPQTPHGPSSVPGHVDVRAEVPLTVAPGEQFTVRVDDLGGDPSIIEMSHAGGSISITGAVTPSQGYTVTQAGQQFTVTATGQPGDEILVRVHVGWAIFGLEPPSGATCTVHGDGLLRVIPIIEPEPTTTPTTAP
jgi:hypothetical protein